MKLPDIEEYLNIGKIVGNLLDEVTPQHGAAIHLERGETTNSIAVPIVYS